MTLHRPSGRARVRLNKIDVYLGDWGSDGAKAEYDRVIQAWLDNDRRWPPPRSAVPDVAALTTLYLEHAKGYYVKDGRQTSTYEQVERTMQLLRECGDPELAPRGLGNLQPGEFTPRHLVLFQRWLAKAAQLMGDGRTRRQRWARQTMNRMVGQVVDLFRWAAAEADVDPAVWSALKAVKPLRMGRAPAPGIPVPREGEEVTAAERGDVARTLRRAPKVIAAMIRLQLATGMRPGEVVSIRPAELRPTKSPGVFVYEVDPGVNKLAHISKPRNVYLGPRAMRLLRRWWPPADTDFFFSPARAEAMRNAIRVAARKTPRQPSHELEGRRQRRPKGPKRYRPVYSVDVYRRAVERACVAADVDVWTPNQLRHSRASETAEADGIEVAMELLGHSNISTTLRYVNNRDRRAIKAAARRG